MSTDVSLTAVASDASEVYRSDRVIALHPRDDVLLSLHRAGTGTVAQHGRVARLGRGRAAMYDAASPYTLSFAGPMREVVLQVPRWALRTRDRAIADLTAREFPDGPPLRALTMLSVRSLSNGPFHNLLETAAVADAMASLFAAAVAASSAFQAPPVSAPVLVTLLQQHIVEHLAEPDLCPEAVAAAHHVSLRLVQRVFADAGDSPAAYIRRHRLEAARAMLRRGATVGSAAWNVGFRDVDTFRRAFRREYGMTPSQIRVDTPHPRA